MSSHVASLKSHYPWISSPLIVSAPMRVIAGPALAVSVSRAGGLGFLGAGTDLSNFEKTLSDCASAFEASPLTDTPSKTIPIGVGFICWAADMSIAQVTIAMAEFKPAAAWLFAPQELEHLIPWARGIRDASLGKTKIWVQVGTVAMAVEVAKLCRPDVLVIQGSDAGGHGLVQSSSIISLLPECADALEKEGFEDIALIAAGGVMDGRGVAAALTLGASGACLGTRFLASPEADLSKGYQEAVLKAHDGGVSTARTSLYDRIRGTPGWPESFGGRGVLNHSFWDHEKGMDETENAKLYDEAAKMGDAGWGEQGRMTTYAGTGVGLVHESMPAGEIVVELIRDSKKHLAIAHSTF